MSLNKERRHFVSIPNVLTILAMAGGLAAGWITLAADSATQKERITNVASQVVEIKQDVRDTKQNVELILRKMIEIEAARKSDDRDARSRDRAK